MLSITETVNLEYIHSAKAYKNEHNKRTSRLKKKVWHKACLNFKENSKRWMNVRQKKILRWKAYDERKIKHKAITKWVKTNTTCTF